MQVLLFCVIESTIIKPVFTHLSSSHSALILISFTWLFWLFVIEFLDSLREELASFSDVLSPLPVELVSCTVAMVRKRKKVKRQKAKTISQLANGDDDEGS